MTSGASDDAATAEANAAFRARKRSIEKTWTTARLCAALDFELSDIERQQVRNIHDWRFLIPRYLASVGYQAALSHIYCFGVSFGSTIAELAAAFRFHGQTMPPLHLFDSFAGLPVEQPGIDRPAAWPPGAYANPIERLQGTLAREGIGPDRFAIYPGWFSETLSPGKVDRDRMQPAAYVDIDCDLYVSTIEALEFMLVSRLIRPGTIIGYDDWGDTELWSAGESRAHAEAMERHGVSCAQLFSWGESPTIRKLFLVLDVRDRAVTGSANAGMIR